MQKTAKRILPPVITFVAGATLAGAVFAAPLATAAPAVVAKPAVSTQQQVQTKDLTAAKTAAQNARILKAANTPPAPSTSQDVKIGGETGRIYYWQISSKKLWVDGVDTGWHTRYDIHVRRADGKVIFDKNLSVYKLAWFVNHFKADKSYASADALVAAVKAADSATEVQARAAFKKSVGSLGEARTTDGKTLKVYDPSQHPGQPYVPLNYDGI